MNKFHTVISSIFISQFRGIEQKSIPLGSRTAIIGENGSGKTHILETLHLASGGQLHYFQAPRDEAYTIDLSITSALGPKKYTTKRHAGREEYLIQGGKVSGSKYREDLPYRTVFLSPFDMNLLYFAPSVRRDYLDSILTRTFAQFSKLKREYENIMRQRNSLLKRIREGEAQRADLDFWDRSFAEKASLYMVYRRSFSKFVHEQGSLLSLFLPKYQIHFRYESKIPETAETEIYIRNYLLEARERDILTGHTHIGPHLDDFGFSLIRPDRSGTSHQERVSPEIDPSDLHDATLILSRGETKMLLLALKQIEVLFLKKQLSLPIVLLFDDLFAELDQKHAEHLMEIFDVNQVIVTTQRLLPVSEKWEDFSCITLNLQ